MVWWIDDGMNLAAKSLDRWWNELLLLQSYHHSLSLGLADKSRLLLCAMMVGVIVVNPAHLVTQHISPLDDTSTRHESRTLNALQDERLLGSYLEITQDFA